MVAPARERGLKYCMTTSRIRKRSRSREGAWIEMISIGHHLRILEVAPARERGLKSLIIIIS
mgnify:CR=1 FL=1